MSADWENRVPVECTCAMTESSLRACLAHGENRPPNEVEVDADGCSCTVSSYRASLRHPVDPACPLHGQPLRHGDGDVLVIHPDGNTSIIKEPR